jgi:hypothetical protein
MSERFNKIKEKLNYKEDRTDEDLFNEKMLDIQRKKARKLASETADETADYVEPSKKIEDMTEAEHHRDMLLKLQQRKAQYMSRYLRGRAEWDEPRIEALDFAPGNRIDKPELADTYRLEKGQDINELPDMKQLSLDIRIQRDLLKAAEAEAKKKK